jgi:hypothetical protein
MLTMLSSTPELLRESTLVSGTYVRRILEELTSPRPASLACMYAYILLVYARFKTDPFQTEDTTSTRSRM